MRRDITKNRYFPLALAALLLLLLCLGLVFAAPGMSLFRKTFDTETVSYRELRAGDSVTCEFRANFDRITGITIPMRGVEEDEQIRMIDASVTLEDLDGNIICTRGISSIYETSFSLSPAGLNRGEVYRLRFALGAENDPGITVGVGMSSEDQMAYSVSGLLNGSPDKQMFIGLYAVFAIIVLLYASTVRQTDPKKTATADRIILLVAVFMSVVLVNQFYDLFLVAKNGLRIIDAIREGKFFDYAGYAYLSELSHESRKMFFGGYYNLLTMLPVTVALLPFYPFVGGYLEYSVAANLIVLYLDALIAVLVLWSVKILDRISDACGMSEQYKRSVRMIYAFSPALIYATVAFGQIDIIYIILMIYALPFFYRERYRTFSLIMAFAILMKLVPLLIVIPLILLTNKKICNIVSNLLIVVSVQVIYNLAMRGGTGMNALSLIGYERDPYIDKIFSAGIGELSLFIIVYAVICIACYMKDVDTKNKKEILYLSMTVIFTVYVTFIAFTDWHAHWVIPVILSLAFLIPFFGDDRRLLTLETAAETLLIIAAAKKSTAVYMTEYGVLASDGYEYRGVDIGDILDNVSPHSVAFITALFAGIMFCLVWHFIRNRNISVRSEGGDAAVCRPLAVGRILILYLILIFYYWCYCYVG